MLSLMAWGNRHFTPEGKALLLVDSKTGKPAEPVLTDRVTGRPVTDKDFVLRPGPGRQDPESASATPSADRPPSEICRRRPIRL